MRHKNRGAVTVFVSLIMTIILILNLILIDAGKLVTARNLISGAGDMALNAGLSNYNSIIQETYGIFAISKSKSELEENLRRYYAATLEANGLYSSEELASYLAKSVVSGGDGIDEIIKIDTKSFTYTPLADSKLTNTAVLKSQMLDYMKYRGPVVIGFGILKKLGAFSGMGQQQQAVEKKMKYEQKLSDIGERMKSLWGYVSSYQSSLDHLGGISEPGRMSEALKDVYRRFSIMTLKTIAYKAVDEFSKPPNWEDEGYDQGGNNAETMEQIMQSFQSQQQEGGSDIARRISLLYRGGDGYTGYLALKDDSLLQKEIEYSDVANSSPEYWVRYEMYYSYHQNYSANVTALQDVHATYKVDQKRLDDEITDLEAQISAYTLEGGKEDLITQNNALIEAKRAEKEKKKNWYDKDFKAIANKLKWETVRDEYKQKLEIQIDMYGKVSGGTLKGHYNNTKSFKKSAEDGLKELDSLRNEFTELGRRRKEWDGSINNLEEGNTKTGMRTEYSAKADEIKIEYLDQMQHIMENGKRYAEDVLAELETVSFMDEDFENVSDDKDWTGTVGNQVSPFIKAESLPKTNAEVLNLMKQIHADKGIQFNEAEHGRLYTLENEAKTSPNLRFPEGENFIRDPYNYNYITFEYKTGTEKNGGMDIFYRYLKRSSQTEATSEEEKNEANSQKSKINEVANKQKKPPKEEKEEKEDARKLEEVMKSSEDFGEWKKNDTTNMDAGGNAGDVADSAIESTSGGTSGFSFDILKDILRSGRDKLYITAYATSMFSCHTTNMDSKGNVQENKERTLSNIPLNYKNNAWYGAEQEYILWGSPNKSSNLTYTKATIFGIRLLLNLTYAFVSDPEIEAETLSLATMIAGWTVFAVPLIQAGLKIAYALAESLYDLDVLLNGGSIPIYKSERTWVFKLSGLGKKAASELAEEAADKAEGMAEQKLYDYMDDFSEEARDNIVNEAGQFADDTIDATVNTAVNSIQVLMNQSVIQCNSILAASQASFESEVEKSVDKSFATLRENAKKESGVTGKAKLAILDAVEEEAKQMLKSECNKLFNESTVKSVSQNVKNWFEGKKEWMKQLARDVASGPKQELEDRIQGALGKDDSEAQKDISSAVDSFNSKMGSSGSSTSEISTNQDVTTSSGISMNYKEYLLLFLVLSKEESTIKHMGNLIQMNARLNGSRYYVSDTFSMDDSYTMIQIETESYVQPTFIHIPRINQNSAAFSGDSMYNVPYLGVLGY